MYYQTLFNGALAGLNSTNLMPAVIKVASVMLIASLLYSVYSAYTASGDVRILATAAIKYLIIGLVLVNYATVFQDFNNAFNGVANYIVSTGPGVKDVFASWGQQIAVYWQSNAHGVSGWLSTIYHLGSGAAGGVVASIMLLAAVGLYRLAYLLFCLFYAVYGSILFVFGPFVLALMPATGIGRISRTYVINLMIFSAWGLIYAILSELIYVLHFNDVSMMLNNSTYLNATISNPMVILGLASLLFAIIIALIPYIASRIVQGDVGATLLTVAGAALTAATVAASAAGTALMGAAGGWGYAASTSGGPGGGGGSGSGSLVSNSSPPKPPDNPGSAPPQPPDGPGGSAGASADSVASSQGSSSSSPAKLMSAEVSSKGGSAQASNAGGDSGAGDQGGRAVAGGGGSGGGRAGGVSKPIPMPWTPGSNMPGHRSGFSFTHAAAWYGAYAARSAYNRMSGANPGGDRKT